MTKKTFRFSPIAVTALALGLTACGDEPAGLDEEHAEPEALELVADGITLASYEGAVWTGELELEAGEESGHIEIRFLDEGGQPIALSDDYYLEVEVEDEAVAVFEQEGEGALEGHVHAVSAGVTGIVFRLMHGAPGTGHAHFETTGLHVHVH